MSLEKVIGWVKDKTEGGEGAETDAVFAGIDPGVTGAVGFVNPGTKESHAWDIPTVTVRDSKNRDRNEYDFATIVQSFLLLRPYREWFRFAVEECIPTVRPGKSGDTGFGRGAMFQNGMHRKETWTSMRMGIGYGFWVGVLSAMSFPWVKTHPTSWKGAMGLLGKDKEVSRQMALGLFGGNQLLRKKDHNRAEALLIAEWHRRKTQEVP